MLVPDGLTESARRFPEKTALVCGSRRLTYAELDEAANRLGNALCAWGVRRGDRVALYMGNSVEAVAGIYAALKAGAVAVPLNRTMKPDKLARILDDCRAAAFLCDEKAAADGTAEALLERTPGLLRAAAGEEIHAAGFSAAPPPRLNIDLDLAFLIYTSGSTGEPKGVMCDHGNVTFAAASIMSYLENTPEDVVLNVLPLSFDYGLYQALMTFTFGGTLVLENSFAFPVEILARIAAERVTGFPGVPMIFANLLQLDLSQFDLSSLRYVTNTAAALPPCHILELCRRLPGVRVFSMYGLTETKRTLYLPPSEIETRPGSVGIAIPGTEVWLENEGERLPPGSTGELVVRGRHVMRGYWNAPELTAARYRPGPLPGERVCLTGDLFHMDREGYLYFVGRKDDIIKSRGEKVAPKEVEAVLYNLPGAVEAAVVGVEDAVLGQAVKAIIVSSRPELTAREVLAHCRANLEDFMIPRYVEFRDSLPRTSSGKIARRELA
jgi:long-chain acyl-CoA synthetase